MRPNRVPSGQSQSADGHVEGQTKDRETRRAQMERYRQRCARYAAPKPVVVVSLAKARECLRIRFP